MQRFKNQYRGDKPLFETDFVNGDIVNVVNVKTAICKEVCARPRRGIVSGAYWRAASPSQCLKTHKRHCDGAGIGLIPCAVGVPPTSVFGGFEASRGLCRLLGLKSLVPPRVLTPSSGTTAPELPRTQREASSSAQCWKAFACSSRPPLTSESGSQPNADTAYVSRHLAQTRSQIVKLVSSVF